MSKTVALPPRIQWPDDIERKLDAVRVTDGAYEANVWCLVDCDSPHYIGMVHKNFGPPLMSVKVGHGEVTKTIPSRADMIELLARCKADAGEA